MNRSQIGVLAILSLLVCAASVVLIALLGRPRPAAPEVPVPTPTIAIEIITTSKGVFSVPGPAYIDGRDTEASPPLTIMSINVWDAVPRQAMVCALPHGARVNLLEAQWYVPEERFYFLVEAGNCRGWLPEPFISDAHHEPIGDQL